MGSSLLALGKRQLGDLPPPRASYLLSQRTAWGHETSHTVEVLPPACRRDGVPAEGGGAPGCARPAGMGAAGEPLCLRLGQTEGPTGGQSRLLPVGRAQVQPGRVQETMEQMRAKYRQKLGTGVTGFPATKRARFQQPGLLASLLGNDQKER